MKARFVKSVIKTAKATEVEMPWSRQTRAANVAKRKAVTELRKSA